MTTKENNQDPIVGSSRGMKSDILMFKDETLKDIKEAQRKMQEKYNSLNIEVKEKLDKYELRINAYETKIMELSKLINTDKEIRDKVDNLMEFKDKTNDTILTEKIRLDNFRNDLNSNVDRIDQILKDSVIYPGVIGGICRYKTFHELIDYVLTQCSLNLTFREKSILDFKSYKTKLENIITSFNTQTTSLLNTTSEYTKTCIKELEERMKSIYNIYDDRLQDARIENANYAIGLEKATEALKKELQNLYIIKKELYEKVDSGILDVKNDNTRVVKQFSGYKKEFKIMEHKFTQLSDFIKDIRFRINMKEDVKRREYSQMSDLINFDKKKKGFYDGINEPPQKNFKKLFGSQIKDYIEGKITADQLFKKRTDLSKSVSVDKQFSHNMTDKRKSSIQANLHIPNLGEDVKLNFVDLLQNSMRKRMSLEPGELNISQNITYKKEAIKEEDEDGLYSSKELNSIFSKTAKEVEISEDEKEKEKEKDKNKEKEKEKVKEENKKEQIKVYKNNGNNEKEEKIENKIKQKKEETKIQIISKDKEVTKDAENNNNNNNNNRLRERPSLKNVITDLFDAKKIISNIKANTNETSPTIKTTTQKEINNLKINLNTNTNTVNKAVPKNNSNAKINNNNKNNTNNNSNKMLKNNNNNNSASKINTNNNNIKIISNVNNNKINSNTINNNNNNNNSNSNYNGTLYNEFTKDYNKTKQNNNLFNKTFTVINIKKPFKNEDKNSAKINNLGEIITKFDTPNEPKSNRMFTYYNKKGGNQDQKPMNANNYNSNMNSLSQYIQTVNGKANSNNNTNTKKKSYSSNQKNSKFVLKQNIFNPAGSNTSYKDYGNIKKDESRKIENMFINLNNYSPKSDINVDDRNFPSIKKKK